MANPVSAQIDQVRSRIADKVAKKTFGAIIKPVERKENFLKLSTLLTVILVSEWWSGAPNNRFKLYFYRGKPNKCNKAKGRWVPITGEDQSSPRVSSQIKWKEENGKQFPFYHDPESMVQIRANTFLPTTPDWELVKDLWCHNGGLGVEAPEEKIAILSTQNKCFPLEIVISVVF